VLSRAADDRRLAVFREVRRVLRPGGLAYIAEPAPGGAFNEITRLFKDEKQARLTAFTLVKDAVASGAMALVAQKFFQMPLLLADFAAVERGYVPDGARLTGAERADAQKKFERARTPKGAAFQVPMRIDLLRKPD
jgi:SAM-dependent methyltransferase